MVGQIGVVVSQVELPHWLDWGCGQLGRATTLARLGLWSTRQSYHIGQVELWSTRVTLPAWSLTIACPRSLNQVLAFIGATRTLGFKACELGSLNRLFAPKTLACHSQCGVVSSCLVPVRLFFTISFLFLFLDILYFILALLRVFVHLTIVLVAPIYYQFHQSKPLLLFRISLAGVAVEFGSLLPFLIFCFHKVKRLNHVAFDSFPLFVFITGTM